MELFLNPWYMVAGGAMVSSPILIHLINRMRFKRIRWAAMEFLLKSQKRNRRRLIIEQLILLLLRCLLVLLAAFLVARFVGSALGLTPTSSTTHVVLLDDTLSMTDRTPRGSKDEPDCFSAAKKHIKTLARHASEANSAQFLKVLTLSDRREIFSDRLNEDSLLRLDKELEALKPTAMHGDTLRAVAEARERLGASKESKRWLHLVSDFRDSDWGHRGATEQLHQKLQEVADTGANVTLIDCAYPTRSTAANRAVEYHYNYALTELRPEKRIAPASTTVPFTVDIKNFGNDSRESVFLEVYLNGVEDFGVSHYYPAPPPGGDIRHTFDLLFEGPAEGQRTRFHRVTVKLMANQSQNLDPEAGLLADNVRHAVIEVRKAVPTLLVDGSPEESQRIGGDVRVIQTALESAKGNEAVQVVVKGVEELKRPDLEREYATIYLLNVESLKGKKDKDGKGENLPLERLQTFVENGGNVVFFMGDKVDPTYYNKVLFEEHHGLFPVPLDKRETERISNDKINEYRASSAPKIFVLEPNHDITRGIAGVQYEIPDLLIPQHAQAKDRFEWERKWSTPGAVKELITLANLKRLDDTTSGPIDRLVKRIPVDDPKYKKYSALLAKHKKAIQTAAGGRIDELYKVAKAFEEMLGDRGPKPGDKDNVSLVEFWELPEMKDLKTDILGFRKDALYGSPLVLARTYGKGNVVAFLTTAGTRWSGWSGGKDSGAASFTFPMLIVDLQKFLTRGGDAGSRLVGEPIPFQLDAAIYRNAVKRFVQVDEGQFDPKRIPADDAPVGFQVDPEKAGKLEDGKYVIAFENHRRTGVQFFQVFPLGKDAVAEQRWFAYNVDTANESNLRRVAFEEVARNPAESKANRGKIMVFVPSEARDELREKRSDLSESPWLYLLILVILIAEQALAVHLSFHVKGSEGTQSGATPAAAASSSAAAA